MKRRHLVLVVFLTHFLGGATAADGIVRESGLSEENIFEVTGIECWKMTNKYLKENKLEGATIEIICRTKDGKLSPVYVGKLAFDSDIILLVQNAQETKRDMGVFLKFADGHFSTLITSLEYNMSDQEILRERGIDSVVLDRPIVADGIHVFIYRPDVEWDRNKNLVPAYDPNKDFFLGLRIKPE